MINSQSQHLTPVLLLTGYLGSGKTTLLNRILNNTEGIRFAVIVNDLGEVNIDSELIAKGGIVGGAGSDDLVALQNGCICCTLKGDLIRQIAELLQQQQFDYIIIEASGICEPEPIAQTVTMMQRMADGAPGGAGPLLDCICTVVDALRMKTEFAGGDALDRSKVDEEDIENLVIQQIEFCNLVLLNKASEISPAELRHLREIIRALQPDVKILECDYCDVPLRELLNTGMFNFEHTATAAKWVRELERPVTDHEEMTAHNHELKGHGHEHEHEHDHEHHHHHHGEGEALEYGIGTFLYYRRRPMDFAKFDDFCARRWPTDVIRCKGVIYFSHNRDMSLLFEQAGSQKNLREAGLWYATAPEEERKELMMNDPAFMRDWDDEYGDRMVKLVFIGRNLDRDAIETQLDACLAK